MFRKHPPGPINFNASFGLTWRHGAALWWDPIGYATWLGHTYGDLAFFRICTCRTYLVNGPELIRDVLVVKQKSFRKLDRSRKVLGSGFGNGLILSEGPSWLRQRRALQPIFHPQQMDRYARITVERTRRMLEAWQAGEPVELAHAMTCLTLTIVGEALFHADLSSQAPHLARQVFELTDIYSGEEYNAFILPDWFPLRCKRRKTEIAREFRSLIRELFEARRAERERGADLIALLISAIDQPVEQGGMSEAQAIDEAMTLFHGGYHSSSMALTWLLFELAKNPEIYARVCGEVDRVLAGREATLADLAALPYTNMVVKEGLRLWPPAWELFSRGNTEEVELGGYRIAPGGMFLIYPFVTHRDARFFPDPLRFDPERFSPEREARIPPFAYFPFGGGPHVCIGAGFASMEIALALASIAQQVQLDLDPAQSRDVKPIPRVAIRPEQGIVIRPRARSDRASTPLPRQPGPASSHFVGLRRIES